MKNAIIISNKIRKIPGGSIETLVNPLKELGYNVYWAANFSTIKVPIESFPCSVVKTESETNPFSFKNFKTRKTILNFLTNNEIDTIFCCTPIGGLHGRLCGKKAGVRKIIYQAHGFLFFKGGPKLGWFYKIIERWLAHYTNAIITINKEDFDNAKKFSIKEKGNIFCVGGSGEDYSPIILSEEDKQNLRANLGLDPNDFVLISIGELNKNKNVIYTVKGFKRALQNNPHLKLLICGEGPKSNSIKRYIKKCGIGNNVLLLGYRNDVKALLNISDCYISTSLREGLSRTVGESMAAGLPCIVSNKRGLVDWIDDGKGGYVVKPRKVNQISDAIKKMTLINSAKSFGEYNKNKVKDFSSERVSSQMREILSKVLA